MKVIGVISGKGGVGKSLVTSLLAVEAARRGLSTGILDADLTGASIPACFGLTEPLTQVDGKIRPRRTKELNIGVVSVNLILEEPSEAVLWKGPMLQAAVGQFFSETNWEGTDLLFVDLPPGTGDVAMAVINQLHPVGFVLVTTPQELVEMVMKKAVSLARGQHVPLLGLVENMSYLACEDCGHRLEVFGPSRVKELGEEIGVEVTAKIPMDPKVRRLIDEGRGEEIDTSALEEFFDGLLRQVL